MPEIVRLRGHHLLCVLGYMGKGYTPEFIQKFDDIVALLNKGADILLVTGKDDLCESLHGPKGALCESGNHCFNENISERDGIAIATVSSALGRDISVGKTVNLAASDYNHLRRLFASGDLRQACTGCDWYEVCTDIADNGFRHVRLMPVSN